MLFCANPFISSYAQSDWFGKAIFLALLATSLMVWFLILYKGWIFFKVKQLSLQFSPLFSEKTPLELKAPRPFKGGPFDPPHPFFALYKTFKQTALELLALKQGTPFTEGEIAFLEERLAVAVSAESRKLEKNLFLLSTAVTLSPFLGLLGTVWGILVTFSEMHGKGISLSNSAMLSGFSLALATTVLGLVIAIPALIGNNVLRSRGRECVAEMEEFASTLVSSLYKKER